MSALRLLSRFAVNQNIQRNLIFGCQQCLISTKKDTDNVEIEKKKRTIPVPRVTLISPDDSMQVVTLDEAQKISKRRDLKLVKIIDFDTKTNRPIYKLMTGADYHVEDLKRREKKKEEKKNDQSVKGEKILLLSSRISEHDLESRIKNIVKWLNKKYEIRVVISGEQSNMEPTEKVYGIIEEKLKAESRFLQKRMKGNEIKFQILPLRQYSTDASDDKKL